MKRATILLPVTILLLFIAGCKKENTPGAGPSFNLKKGMGYVSGDTLLAPGAQFKFGISVNGGDENVTNIILKINSGTEQVYSDTGINNKNFYFEKLITKSAAAKDIWTIIVRDKAGLSSTLSFTVSKDPFAVFGQVKTFQNITLGAQNNSTTGSFFNPGNGNIYLLPQAFLVQDSIDMLYFYDPAGDGNTIASPNANIDSSNAFGGIYGLFHWGVKHETRYYKTSLAATDFNTIVNDSLLLASYNELLGKRKAKNLVPGDIYSFKTADSKYGLFMVNVVNGTDAGTIDVDIKFQD
ncbi:MAG: hypothetical protein WCM76_01850 [Bacteroidota bacterium]